MYIERERYRGIYIYIHRYIHIHIHAYIYIYIYISYALDLGRESLAGKQSCKHVRDATQTLCGRACITSKESSSVLVEGTRLTPRNV